jgi:hypothetical protein
MNAEALFSQEEKGRTMKAKMVGFSYSRNTYIIKLYVPSLRTSSVRASRSSL